MGSEITDDTVEPLAYAVCNTDGVEGLSWPEVDLCEVSKCKYEDIRLEYFRRGSCFEGTQPLVIDYLNFSLYFRQCIARTYLLTAQQKLTLTFLMPMEMES